jgi:nitrate/nitrite-specific signal transduction histidine kinase
MDSVQGALIDRLDALAGRWRGFLTLRWSWTTTCERSPAAMADRVERIVDEAVVNAMRHGLATRARIVAHWTTGSSRCRSLTTASVRVTDGRGSVRRSSISPRAGRGR